MMNPIDEIVNNIKNWNDAYRLGNPLVSDAQYDHIIEQLYEIDPTNEVFFEIGHVIIDEARKASLPTTMASMDKYKSIDDLMKKWINKIGMSPTDELIISPKLDGISFCVVEEKKQGFTRGNGEVGQKSDEHLKIVGNNTLQNPIPNCITFGEVVMSKQVFIDKYSEDFANPRNLVAGLFNSDDASEPISDCNYIRYGLVSDGLPFETKKDKFDYLNKNQTVPINYLVVKIQDLTEEILLDLFKEWSIEYDIDGLILEVNNLTKQEQLGRERNMNPAWARAFKHPSFEMTAEAEILKIPYTISKQGYLKPVIHITPTKLDGATVRKITGNNARFIKRMGIGVGGKILVKRSGMVIPLVVAVLEKKEFVYPLIEGTEIGWNPSGAELMTLTVTDEQRFKQAVSFFEILQTDGFSEGTIKQLWDNGYNSIHKISLITQLELSNLPGFADRKSEIVFKAIKAALNNVPLSKLQHASGLFKQLGSKKLLLLEDFNEVPTIEEITKIEGFAEVSALAYLDAIQEFNEFIQTLPVTISKKIIIEKVGNDLDGKVFVFTGVRSKEMEEKIISRGGKIASGISKNSTHLIMKATGSGSSKENKAMDLGITILMLAELETLLA